MPTIGPYPSNRLRVVGAVLAAEFVQIMSLCAVANAIVVMPHCGAAPDRADAPLTSNTQKLLLPKSVKSFNRIGIVPYLS